jgi:Arc-like DNA binding domain
MANQFKLRLPDQLREQLEESIKRSGNSLNTEIVWRLGQSFLMDQLREGLRRETKRADEAQRRANQLTDYLLQITTTDRVPQEEPEKGEAA